MTAANTLLAKSVAVVATVALALGLFAVPALALVNHGDVIVTNTNVASVTNNVDAKANTGKNDANGDNAGSGGSGGDGGDDAGDGGEGGKGESDADGGNGGDAEGYGDNLGGYGGNGGNGGNGGDGSNGGNTGNGGSGGAGGNGGMGGIITTGDAAAAVAVANDVNYNETDITTDNCDCEVPFDIWEKETWRSYGGERRWHDRSSYEFHKEHVDVDYGDTGVHNTNVADVNNDVDAKANTGKNDADGGEGDNGGSGGDAGDGAGNGGDGGDGENKSDGGNGGAGGGDYEWNEECGCYNLNVGGDGGAGGNGGNGGDSGKGGNTGDGDNGGRGGEGGRGGDVWTGRSDSAAAVVNVVNRNLTRVSR